MLLATVAHGEMLEHLVGPGDARCGLPQPPAMRPGAVQVAVVDEAAADRLPAVLPALEVVVRRLSAPTEVLAARCAAAATLRPPSQRGSRGRRGTSLRAEGRP